MDMEFNPLELVPKAECLLGSYSLCTRCLGRCFANLGHGMSNVQRGERILTSMTANNLTPVSEEECDICRGIFSSLDLYVDSILHALEPYEFRTFVVGTRVDADIIEVEGEIWRECGVGDTAESIKSELNRTIGLALREHYRFEGKDRVFEPHMPEMVVVVDTTLGKVEVTPRSLYIFGRYIKMTRGIPQTKWPCRVCRGRGCRKCNYTGKMYEKSVEEIIAAPFMEVTGAEEHAFHGLGREDIDARMLGNGRPFVLELKRPEKRSIDIPAIERAVNEAQDDVKVTGLRECRKDMIPFIKDLKTDKSYVVSLSFNNPVERNKLQSAIEHLNGVVVRQRTPRRVSHRRADKVRKRAVRDIVVEEWSEGLRARLRVRGESGLYIKELMHGDHGRTEPSLAALVGTEVRVESLDVVAVHDENIDYTPHLM